MEVLYNNPMVTLCHWTDDDDDDDNDNNKIMLFMEFNSTANEKWSGISNSYIYIYITSKFEKLI